MLFKRPATSLTDLFSHFPLLLYMVLNLSYIFAYYMVSGRVNCLFYFSLKGIGSKGFRQLLQYSFLSVPTIGVSQRLNSSAQCLQ